MPTDPERTSTWRQRKSDFSRFFIGLIPRYLGHTLRIFGSRYNLGILPANKLGGFLINLAVQGNGAAERGYSVRHVGSVIGFTQRRAPGYAAGIVVFDNYGAGSILEIA